MQYEKTGKTQVNIYCPVWMSKVELITFLMSTLVACAVLGHGWVMFCNPALELCPCDRFVVQYKPGVTQDQFAVALNGL